MYVHGQETSEASGEGTGGRRLRKSKDSSKGRPDSNGGAERTHVAAAMHQQVSSLSTHA